MPAALYVIVAGFAGSIVASRRMSFAVIQSFLGVSLEKNGFTHTDHMEAVI